MATTNGQVAEKIASINNTSAATSGNVDSDGQSSSGRVAPPGHQQARVGKQGEQFCKDFCVRVLVAISDFKIKSDLSALSKLDWVVSKCSTILTGVAL